MPITEEMWAEPTSDGHITIVDLDKNLAWEMSRFEWTLRSYCSGYIAGRRAEAPPRLITDEALPTDA